MKIAIMSDFHFGFGEKGDRVGESFENARQAIELALENGAEMILIPGDMFDEAIPPQDVLYKAIEILLIPKGIPSKNIDLKKIMRDGKEKEIYVSGIPVVAIPGTHEFRGKDHKNILELLERADLLLNAHASTIIFEKGDEKIAVQGMGGVPEKKALEVLQLLSPEPVPDAKNIFIFHQSLNEFLPFNDDMISTLSLDDLPKGFELLIDGHLHWKTEQNLGESKFIMPGSTIITQSKKIESENSKGIYIFDSKTDNLKFLSLPKQRKLFYHKIKFEGENSEQVLEMVKNAICGDLKNDLDLPPIIRLKLTGKLAKGYSVGDIPFNEILAEVKGKAIFSISREFAAEGFKKRISELREMQRSKKSVAEMGLDLLEKNLKETDFKDAFDFRRFFELLAENELEKANELVLGKK
ncbi:MAG: DNA repair exonuclease [Candidatus Diapherotrites archaeon]